MEHYTDVVVIRQPDRSLLVWDDAGVWEGPEYFESNDKLVVMFSPEGYRCVEFRIAQGPIRRVQKGKGWVSVKL